MLKQRIITAIILVVLFLIAVFFSSPAIWSLIALLVVGQGAVEWARLSNLHGRAATAYWALALMLMLLTLWFDLNVDAKQQSLNHLPWYGAAVLLWVLVVPAWLIAGWRPRNVLVMGAVGWVVLIPTALALIDLRAITPWLLLAVMSTVWVADIAAYFSGRRFGKRKLAPSISPGKTWEGVFGALILVSIYVIALVWATGYIKQFITYPGVIVAVWWWVGLSVIGDLFESAVKRQAGVKDSGALLPGHGGLLDRIDALTATLPFAAITLVFERWS